MMRSITIGLATVGIAATVSAYRSRIRPRLLRWGVTEDEAHRHLPGDDEVPDPRDQFTYAITVAGRPEDIWPWLAQMGYHGYDRAGWYAYDRFDNDGLPSADRIIPEFQHSEVGQRVGEEGFRIVALDPPHTLVLAFHYDTISWVVKQGVWPLYGHCSWAFVVEPLDVRRTRLIARTRSAFRPRNPAQAPLLLVSEAFVAANALVQRAQLRNIKRQVERQAQHQEPAPRGAVEKEPSPPSMTSLRTAATTRGAQHTAPHAARTRNDSYLRVLAYDTGERYRGLMLAEVLREARLTAT